jgi:hypothetical protein
VSIIDDYVFGDLKSFKSRFSHQLDEEDYTELKNRLKPVCKRTLRKQVLEYISYTERKAICQEFYPTGLEQELYDAVTDYLHRPKLYALPSSQRSLMTLILRKLLASSTYAIYGTFETMIARLEALIATHTEGSLNDVELDFEKHIAQIYHDCRNPEEIKNAFDELQEELKSEISELNSIEKRFKQSIIQKELFTIKWKIV